MLKPLAQKAIIPQQNILDQVQLRNAFHEIMNDFNSLVEQWNLNLQPLVDSLPGGRTRRSANDRDSSVNPFTHGFDGSQFYMDMTATAAVNNGLLYSILDSRPKTVKEVVLDNYTALLEEIRQLRSLVDEIDPAASDYDDTTVKAWIRRLAANTVSDDALADPFDVAFFAGNQPTKTVEYSLNQRDNNLREIIGVGSADYSLILPGFAGTNYIDGMDLIEALQELDSQVGGVGGAATLQSAYTAGETITISTPDAGTTYTPVEILGPAWGRGTLRVHGRVDIIDPDSTAVLKTATSFLANFDDGTDEISNFAVMAGGLAGTGGTAAVDIDNNTDVILKMTKTIPVAGDDTLNVVLGHRSGTTDILYSTLEGGTRTTGAGGGYLWRILSEDDAGIHRASLDSRGHLSLLGSSDIDLIAGADALIEATTLINLNSFADILIASTTQTQFSVGSLLDIGCADLTIAATDVISISSTNQFGMGSVNDDVVISALNGNIELTADSGVGDVISLDAGQCTIRSRVAGALYAPFFTDEATAEIVIADFAAINVDTPQALLYGATEAFQEVSTTADPNPDFGIYASFGAFIPNRRSPEDLGTLTAPVSGALYYDNVCKGMVDLHVDFDKDGAFGRGESVAAYNVRFSGEGGTASTYAIATGQVTLQFITALPDSTGFPGEGAYSVSATARSSTKTLICKVVSKTSTSCVIEIKEWDDAAAGFATAWVVPTADYGLSIQVM